MAFQKELKYEIINSVGIVSEQASGWKKELNRVSWNGGEPKYDIRDWSPDHDKMGKGITLTEAELRSLKVIIDEEEIALTAGNWLRIAPVAKRQFFAANDESIKFICIQVKANSLEGYTVNDAVIY